MTSLISEFSYFLRKLEEIEKKNERIVQLNTKNNLKEEVKEIDTDLLEIIIPK